MTEIHKSTINCCVEINFAFLNTGSDLSSLMIHPNYSFNIVQSVIGQLSSDHSNFIESLTPFFGIDSLLEANNNTNCSSVIWNISWTDPILISALTCLLIGLIMGLLIIFIKNLHTPSTKNTVIIIITMLLLGYGVVALNSLDEWYNVLIKDWLSIVTTIVAMILGERTEVLSVKWRKILFEFACLLIFTGIIFTILGYVFKDIIVTRVDFWSMWYLLSRTSPSKYTFIYGMFFIFYEFVVLNIILQSVFAITGCKNKCILSIIQVNPIHL
ncbi:hypothetical protein KSF78_0007846 [Schistosoma japonicum]|nr:hypothetical protein KSF78_0007846 [Schistosoma japonicum]